MPTAFDTVIIGAGNAGISLAARLRRDGVSSIAIIDPSPVHRYRPMLNYAAAGQARMSRYERAMEAVVPDGVELIRDAATRVDPDARTVFLDSGASVSFRDLVLCPGLTPHWEKIPGLHAGYVDGWAVSAHVPEYAGRACAALVREREGAVVFSVPPEPASCGGTVLKAMFMACDRWRRENVLDQIDVHLVTPFRGVLGLEPADSRLRPFIAEYGITVHDETTVDAVDHRSRRVFLDGPTSTTIEQVKLAYVTPHSRAPRFIADSGLGDDSEADLVAVDPHTLRHLRADSVWGLGDAATVGTRPSGGALRDQVGVVADNLRAARVGGSMSRYDGYTVIPVTVSRDRLLLAEFDGDGRPAPSVSAIDLTTPRRATYLFDRFGLPQVYFRRILRGRV